MKKTNALAIVATEPDPELWEKEITCEFECGGCFHVTARGQNLFDCLASVLNGIQGPALQQDGVFSMRLKYWQLDEELDDLILETSVHDNPEGRWDRQKLVSELAVRVKARFTRMLANQGITLYGPLGALERSGE
jgi:hypothetical protein